MLDRPLTQPEKFFKDFVQITPPIISDGAQVLFFLHTHTILSQT